MTNLHIQRRAFSLSLLALAACGQKPAPPAAAPAQSDAVPPPAPRVSDLTSLQALLDAQVHESGIPGVGAAVFDLAVFRLMAASGVRIAGRPDTVTIGDLWHLGSCTKAMTAALYARLVEQGRAKWGAKLPELFPDLAKSLNPAFAETTIEAVFNHRTGLGDFDDPLIVALSTDKRPLMEQRSGLARDFLSKPPEKTPGEFSYSNIGYVIAGAAIERITGKPWEEAMREHLFGPLGMERVGFGSPKGNQPQGHIEDRSGLFIPVGTGVGSDNPPAAGPAGTVHAPFEDWVKFARVFLDPAPTFLSTDSVQHLITPPSGQDYACGWLALNHPVGGRILAHTGSNNMWMAQVIVLRDHGAGLLTGMNAAGPKAEKAHKALAASLIASIAET